MFAAAVLLATAPAGAQHTLRVIDAAANDVLNVRELPTTDARIVGVVPPDGRGLVASGEVEDTWLFVRYGRVEDWVARRFVEPEAPPVQRGRLLADEGAEN